MGRRIGLACMAASAPDGPPLVMPVLLLQVELVIKSHALHKQRISSTRRDETGGPLCEPALGALYTLARGKVTSVRGFILTK